MKKLIYAAFLTSVSWLYSSTVLADSLLLRSDYPDKYVVVQGDTLWDIAGRFLNNPWDWPEIWEKNTDVVEDPHWIYPGEALYLRFDDMGNPYLSKDIGPSDIGLGLDTVKLSPEVRISDLDQAIPAVPLDLIQPFINGAQVYPQGVLDAAPYIFAHEEDEIVGDKGEWMFARGNTKQWVEGEVFQIVRQSQNYVSLDDPDTILGVEAELIGQAVVENVRNDIAALEILNNVIEVRKGDRLVPSQYVELASSFMPTPGKHSARLIDSISLMEHMSAYDAAVIDLGKASGVKEGEVFEIYDEYQHTSVDVYDQQANELHLLPQKRKGLGMVFKVFDNVSYVLIMESLQPIKKGDWLGSPQ